MEENIKTETKNFIKKVIERIYIAFGFFVLVFPVISVFLILIFGCAIGYFGAVHAWIARAFLALLIFLFCRKLAADIF